MRSADVDRLKKLRREMRAAFRSDPVSAAKYTDYHFWLMLNLDRAGYLGLHTSAPLRILDIGSGPGYFLALSRALGHDCSGVDVPEEYFTAIERKVYRELLGAIRCAPHTSRLAIEKFAPLPFESEQYDLITAFWICFNRHRMPGEWGAQEWRFFLDDARRCLRPGGKLHLELVEHRERYPELGFYDEETLAHFQLVGQVTRGRVVVPKG
jgi:SAM-dependent methyltransferase